MAIYQTDIFGNERKIKETNTGKRCIRCGKKIPDHTSAVTCKVGTKCYREHLKLKKISTNSTNKYQ